MSNKSTRNPVPEKSSKYSKLRPIVQDHCGNCKEQWVESRIKAKHEAKEQ